MLEPQDVREKPKVTSATQSASKSLRRELRIPRADLVGLIPDPGAATGATQSSGSLSSSQARGLLSEHGMVYPQQVVSFQMLKGGVAKTTSALSFGLRASMYGARVLMVDLDQQANLSFALDPSLEEAVDFPVWLDVVEKKVGIQDCIRPIAIGLDLLPSSLNNSVLDRALLNGQRNWAASVRAPLEEVRKNYDLVVIDTAPALSAVNTAVTCASDVVVLPVNPDRFSLLGMQKHWLDLEELRSEFQLRFTGKILFTRFDRRESLSREILGEVVTQHEANLLKTYVRTCSDLKNSVGTGRNVFSAKGPAKEDYDAVTRELMGWKLPSS